MKIYQQLNEQRTQGEWEINEEDNTVSKYRMYSTKDGANIMWLDPDDESKDNEQANAQYTALAVNNLHHLAEALEKLIEANRKGEAQGTNWINAQQALSRIS